MVPRPDMIQAVKKRKELTIALETADDIDNDQVLDTISDVFDGWPESVTGDDDTSLSGTYVSRFPILDVIFPCFNLLPMELLKETCCDENVDVKGSYHRIPSVTDELSMSLPSVWNLAFELDKDEPLLGGGAFSKILRVTERASGTEYAIKVMNRHNFAVRGIEAQLDAEIVAMQRCAKSRQCRHVVRLYEIAEENQHVYLRLELCKFDLLQYSNTQPRMRIMEHETQSYTRQLLVGLRDLHSLGILHRDIKPENLLVTADGILKIADFGWWAELSEAPSSFAGTFRYMAPEILGSMGIQTEAVDVWSSGVTLLQLSIGRAFLTTYLGPSPIGMSNTDPHQAMKMKTSQLLDEIYQKCPLSDELRPADVSWKCWDCLRGMLIPEVAFRKTIRDSLGHPWLEEPTSNGTSDVLFAQLDESPSNPILLTPKLASTSHTCFDILEPWRQSSEMKCIGA